jgi:hypothetical protein
MKHICSVGVAILLAACSSHRVRCGSALRPINKAVVAAKPVAGAHPADGVNPVGGAEPVAAAKSTVPGSAAAAPGPAAGEPQSLPVVPRP